MVSITEVTKKRYTAESNDKNTFRLKAESHDIPLAAILCEQGNS